MWMVMRRKWMLGFLMLNAFEVLVLTFLFMPAARAADADAAQVDMSNASRDQILQTIETTRQSDPELATEMERQLELMEAGEVAVEGPERAAEHRTDEYMPPEVRAQLEKLFQEKGTGDPSKDAHVREEAERIMREHGIEPPKWEHEGEWEHGKEWGPHGGKEEVIGKEHWGKDDWRDIQLPWEGSQPPVEGVGQGESPQATPEAMEHYREMMEQGTSQEHQREYEAVRESFVEPTERTYESSGSTYEAPERTTTYEAPTAPERDYREYEQYQGHEQYGGSH